MNFKLPPGVDPPPFPSVENGFGYRVPSILNDPRFDYNKAMNAFIELQRPLIEARRREAQAQAGGIPLKRIAAGPSLLSL